jgi:hypothetical protein
VVREQVVLIVNTPILAQHDPEILPTLNPCHAQPQALLTKVHHYFPYSLARSKFAVIHDGWQASHAVVVRLLRDFRLAHVVNYQIVVYCCENVDRPPRFRSCRPCLAWGAAYFCWDAPPSKTPRGISGPMGMNW